MTNNKPIFITRYALTQGILIRYDWTIAESSKRFVTNSGLFVLIGHFFEQLGVTAFTNKDEARAAAEGMRRKKIESLKKQLAKLESMKIKFVESE